MYSPLTFHDSSSWKKTSPLVVEKGTPNESFPPPVNALLGVQGSALRGVGYTGKMHGLLDEESASNDEDEPDD